MNTVPAAEAGGENRAGGDPGHRGLSRVALWCFAAVCAASLLILLTWGTGLWQLTALVAGYVPVAPSTALLFLALGGAALLRVKLPGSEGTRWFAWAAIGGTMAMVLLVWAAFLLGRTLPLERWLAHTTQTVGAIPAGVMSPLSAAVFLMAALALLFQLPLLSRRIWQRQTSAVFALAVVFHGTGVALGYGLRVPVLYGEAIVPMAAATAGMFILLGLGLLCMAGGKVWPLALFVPSVSSAPSRHSSVGGLLALFAVFAAAIGATAFFYTERQAMDARKAAYETLDAIANLKVHEIVSWRGERLGDAAAIAGNPLASDAAAKVIEGTADEAAREQVRRWLTSLQVYAGYRSLCLVDREGRVALVAGEPSHGIGSPGRGALREALASGKAVLTGLHETREVGYIHMELFVPVHGLQKGAAAGAVLIRIDPAAYLYPMLANWPAPTTTGETLLVRRDGSDVLYLNPLRFDPEAALKLRLPVATPGLPAALAVTGKEGNVEGRDYAGREVLAYVRSVPGSPWLIVAKADRSELLAPARRSARGVFVMALLLVLATGGAMGAVWRNQQMASLRRAMAAERDRQALLRHFEFLFKYANDMILLADARGRYVEANDSALRAYGYTREEMLALTMEDARAPESREQVSELLSRLESAGASGLRFETLHVRKDGSVFPVEVSARVVNVDGVPYYQAIVRDITGRKRAEEELVRSAQELARHSDELARSNAELQQFAYVASHDLQEPLRIISSYAQLLERRYEAKLDGDAKEFLDFIVDAAKRMQRLINDLLDYSRVGTKGSDMALLEIGEALGEAESNLKIAIEETGTQITRGPLPEVFGDRRQIVQLFQNLLSNAIKFRGAEQPRIHVSASRKGKEWIFAVKDNGIGMDPQFRDRIFIIFQRLHGREEYPGTGIGLAICQKIVQRHKGKIWVESRPGEGSAFFFTLPGVKVERGKAREEG